MPRLASIAAKLAPHLIVFAIGFGLAWAWQSNSYTSQISSIRENHQQELRKIEKARADQQEKFRQREASLQEKVERIDEQRSQELKREQNRNDNLRDSVNDGSRQLRIARANLETCRITAETTGAASVDDDATVGLSQEAGRTILDIRSGMIEDKAKIRALQDYVRSIREGQ